MITYSRLGNYGRLGNQLFQYAILLSVGNEKGYEIKIPNYNNRIWDGQKCLLNNFNISAKFLNENDIIRYRFEEPQSYWTKYDARVFDVNDGTDFFGYFQNYMYYKKYANLIIKELIPNENLIIENLKTLNKIKEKYSGYEIVSLHLRRGDGHLWIYGDDKINLNSIWWKYFNNSKQHFLNKKVKFLVFTGGATINDISVDDDYIWCKKNLNTDEYIYFDYNRNTMNDFTLMYLCDHHILSFGSSLSWWVGFLNYQKTNKIIVASKISTNSVILPDGYYPNNFILV